MLHFTLPQHAQPVQAGHATFDVVPETFMQTHDGYLHANSSRTPVNTGLGMRAWF